MPRDPLEAAAYAILVSPIKILVSILSSLWVAFLVVYRGVYYALYLSSSSFRQFQPFEQDISHLPRAKPGKPEPEDAYRYTRLPGKRYIRILELKNPWHATQTQTHQDNVIQCELHTVSLDKHVLMFPYRAMSYSWDDQKMDRHVLISGNQKKLAVTKNCEDILRHMLLRGRLYIWIDAICIDQSSPEEKSLQIPLMTEIYQRAHTVNIWLGLPTAGTDLAWSYVWLFWCWTCLPIASVRERVESWSHGVIRAQGHTPLFLDLLRRSWWRRVWTIQESVFIPTENWYNPCPMLVNCGTLEMPLDCLSGALMQFSSEHQSTYMFNHTVWMHYLSAHSRFTLSKNMELHGLMFRSRACQATDPRDKVYGLYGVLQHLGVELSPPDYTKTKDEVFWDFTREACLIANSLSLLKLVNGPSSCLSAPSWVPDYAGEFRMGDAFLGGKPAGDSRPTFHFSEDHRTLYTSGMLVDLIESRTTLTVWHPSSDPTLSLDGEFVNLEEHDGYEQTVAAYREWYSLLISNLSHLLPQYGNDPKLLMLAFGRALTLGITTESLANSLWVWTHILDPTEDRTEFFTEAQQHPKIKAHFYDTDDESRKRLTQSEEWQTLCALKTCKRTAQLTHLIWMHAARKSIFVTRRGYIGCANLEIQQGDVVGLLSGFDLPVVLRFVEEKNRFRVVGQAYIGGMMEGEKWDREKVITLAII